MMPCFSTWPKLKQLRFKNQWTSACQKVTWLCFLRDLAPWKPKESGGGGEVHLHSSPPPPTDIFLFFSFFTETRNSQMQVKKQKIFYNIKKSSVVGVGMLLRSWARLDSMAFVGCMDRKEVKTVPGGAWASAASNYRQGQCLYFMYPKERPRRLIWTILSKRGKICKKEN